MLIGLMIAFSAQSTTVRLETSLGHIDIEMLEQAAPNTVENFLNYVNDGDYDQSIFHRLSYGFVLQGGQFYSDGNTLQNIPADPPVANEFNVSNTKYTVAMAKLNDQPNSATNNFFINLKDNSDNLDNQNGGFTVFGKVVQGQDVVNTISSLVSRNSAPLYDYDFQGQPELDDFVYINRAFVLSEKFQINAGLSGAWFNPETNGQGVYLEVLPSVNLLISAWFTYDLLPPEATLKNGFAAAEHRWLTMEGQYNEDTVESVLILTKGGVFDSGEPVNNSLYGAVSIQFSSCNRAIMTYEITDPEMSGTIPLHRQSDANLELCQTLAAKANQGVMP